MPLIKSTVDATWTVRLELEAGPQATVEALDHIIQELRAKLSNHVTVLDGDTFAVERLGGSRIVVWIAVEAESEAGASERVRHAVVKAGEEFELSEAHVQAMSVRRRWEAETGAAGSADEAQPLVGMKELRVLLGLSKQRTALVVKRLGFPTPVVDLASGPVWDAVKVKRFVTAWEPRRKPGRPRSSA